jgi:hypothetical protein
MYKHEKIHIFKENVPKILFDQFVQVLPFVEVVSNGCTQLYNMFYNKN